MPDDLPLDQGWEDDEVSNPCPEPTFPDLVERRLNRRSALRAGAAGLSASVLSLGPARAADDKDKDKDKPKDPPGKSTLTFPEIDAKLDDRAHVARGYEMQVLVRWGDKLAADAPDFKPNSPSAAAQEKQLGYNCDFLTFMPLPPGSKNSNRGLLCVNHEYTSRTVMFPRILGEKEIASKDWTDMEMAAHGASIVEIAQTGRKWDIVVDSIYNRRLSMLSTLMRISGPAAGHPRMVTKADPTGTRVIGTLNNCAGGVTPWGTVLTCEENIHKYFGGDPAKTPEERNFKRFAIGGKNNSYSSWPVHHPRFDIEKDPYESNRFGWVVEFDPYDPDSRPVKRTALGRVKHEGCGVVVNWDGRVVVYSGDDQKFEYVYKFVSHGVYNPREPASNRDLLDHGTLYVLTVKEDGTARWLPLVFGVGPLTPASDFASQADVLIETRRAADLVGATPMDRPEDIEVSPKTGNVYVMLTNNTDRKRVNPANPRTNNKHGHILELIPPKIGDRVDHAAVEFTWEIFLQCGDPSKGADQAIYGPNLPPQGYLSCPDNAAFDAQGRMWIATDGARAEIEKGDGLWACDTTGSGRAVTRRFFATPRGAEACGPCFTPDHRTLFVSVQHPGEEEDEKKKIKSTFANPTTRWPDFRGDMPPRPSVVAITKIDGGVIGT